MRDIHEVLRLKKAQLDQLTQEISALELVAPMLDDGTMDPLTAARVGAGVNKAPIDRSKWP